jgi:hypothetical protein
MKSIKTTWHLYHADSKNVIVVCDDLRLAKFVQLLTSKMIPVHIVPGPGHARNDLTDTEQKIKLVYDIVHTELTAIDYYLSNEKLAHQIEILKINKEFLDIVVSPDPQIEYAFNIELESLMHPQQICNQHKSFVFGLLYGADYSKSAEDILNWFITQIRSYSLDRRNVVFIINKQLEKIRV